MWRTKTTHTNVNNSRHNWDGVLKWIEILD